MIVSRKGNSLTFLSTYNCFKQTMSDVIPPPIRPLLAWIYGERVVLTSFRPYALVLARPESGSIQIY